MKIRLQSGTMREDVEIPDGNVITFDTSGTSIRNIIDIPKIICSSITNPVEAPPQPSSPLNGRSTVSVIVDDASRPTPTAKVIPELLAHLGRQGVSSKRLRFTIANGLHRETTAAEKKAILGAEVVRQYNVVDNVASEMKNYRLVARTNRGTPLYLNRRVAESDLIITVGTVKSHSFAGFTGGAKSILPGVSGMETILRNHSYSHVEFPNGLVGDADASVPRQDMEDAARLLPTPLFTINTVLDGARNIVGVFSGDVVSAHRKAVELAQRLNTVKLSAPADIVILEGRYPSSESLYFSMSNMAAVLGSRNPVIREGGTVILISKCSLGIGAPIVEELFKYHGSPEAVLHHLRTHETTDGQWAAQHLAFYLNRRRISIVSPGIPAETARMLKMTPFNTAQDAVDDARASYGPEAKILIVRDPNLLYRIEGDGWDG